MRLNDIAAAPAGGGVAQAHYFRGISAVVFGAASGVAAGRMCRPVASWLFGAVFTSLLVCAVFCSPAAAFEPVTPIPRHVEYNHAKALLGRSLFSDPILSLDRTVSCASCHELTHGGADTKPVSIGVKGQKGTMNTPTVFNAVFNFRQCWNGRDSDLCAQAGGPIRNPQEMGMTAKEVERRLNANARYCRTFHEVYGRDHIEYGDVLDAIAEFEKALITPDSRFDRYLRGEIDLTAAEKKGYSFFKELGCIACHNGVNLGGNSFQKAGALKAYPWDAGDADRFKLTKVESDKNLYKVPTLRNIALTAPYFHDGSQKTLAATIEAMATYNLGLQLTPDEERSLLAFLASLTGRLPAILTSGPHLDLKAVATSP